MTATDTAVPVQPPGPSPTRPGRPPLAQVRDSLRRAAPALAAYAAIRLAGMVCVVVWAWRIGKHPLTLLGYSWDCIWYVGIARRGYGTSFPSPDWPDLTFSDLAFFPLLPGLVRAVATVTPLSTVSAGLLVAWVSAGVAAWGIHAVAKRLYGKRVALWAVVLWGLLPHAIVQSMTYTEPLLTALAAWSLYGVLTDRWLWAGSLALLAGVCRPSGIAVAAAVWACVAAAALGHRPAAARPAPTATPTGPPHAHPAATPRTHWRMWLAAVLAPLGWLGFLAWVGARRGEPLGYFGVQRDWGSRFDLGRDTLRSIRHLLIGREILAQYMVLAVLGMAAILLALLVLDRPPLALLVYTLVLVVLALGGAGYFASKPRFLLPAFPLLFPAAVAMARARPRTVRVTVGALAGLSCLYGTYLLAVAPEPM